MGNSTIGGYTRVICIAGINIMASSPRTVKNPKHVAIDLYRLYRQNRISKPDSIERMTFLLITTPTVYPMGLINEILDEIENEETTALH